MAKLQGIEAPKKGCGLEYAYIEIRDEYRDGMHTHDITVLAFKCMQRLKRTNFMFSCINCLFPRFNAVECMGSGREPDSLQSPQVHSVGTDV